MDDFEKRALRSKRKILEENVQIDDDVISSLKRSGALGDKEIEKIQDRKGNHDRVGKLFELLFASDVTSAFDSLCAAITPQASWLSRDLQTDVQADRGNIKIDDEIWQEASAIIHRKFAMNKRISDADRDEMKQLLATKLQLSGDEWRKQARLMHDEQARTAAELRQRDHDLRAIDNLLTSFLRDHDRQLTTYAHDMRTTRDILMDAKSTEEDTDGGVRARLADLCKRMSLFLSDYELAMQNRRLCFQLLGVNNFDGDSTYDALRHRLSRDAAQLERARDELRDSEHKYAQLRLMFSGATNEDEDSDDDEVKKNNSDSSSSSARDRLLLEKEIRDLREETNTLRKQLQQISDKHPPRIEIDSVQDAPSASPSDVMRSGSFGSGSPLGSSPKTNSAGISRTTGQRVGSPKTVSTQSQPRNGSPKTVTSKRNHQHGRPRTNSIL